MIRHRYVFQRKALAILVLSAMIKTKRVFFAIEGWQYETVCCEGTNRAPKFWNILLTISRVNVILRAKKSSPNAMQHLLQVLQAFFEIKPRTVNVNLISETSLNYR